MDPNEVQWQWLTGVEYNCIYKYCTYVRFWGIWTLFAYFHFMPLTWNVYTETINVNVTFACLQELQQILYT